MKVLAIGNSYSQDGTRYVHDLAKSCSENIHITNLCIGGCTLSRHYRNILSDEKAYIHEFNGIDTGLKVSLKDVLLTTEWDVITIRQQSFNSTKVSEKNAIGYIIMLASFSLGAFSCMLLIKVAGYHAIWLVCFALLAELILMRGKE